MFHLGRWDLPSGLRHTNSSQSLQSYGLARWHSTLLYSSSLCFASQDSEVFHAGAFYLSSVETVSTRPDVLSKLLINCGQAFYTSRTYSSQLPKAPNAHIRTAFCYFAI